MQLAKAEKDLKTKKATIQKDFEYESKKEGVLQYIDDLQTLIQSNLDEIKHKLSDDDGDRKPLQDMLDEKINMMNELKDGAMDDIDAIIK